MARNRIYNLILWYKKRRNKCIKCQQIRKASGRIYLKCRKCKQKASDERKKIKRIKAKWLKLI